MSSKPMNIPLPLNHSSFNNKAIPDSLNKQGSFIEKLTLSKNDNKLYIDCRDDVSTISSDKPIKINGVDMSVYMTELNKLKEVNKDLNEKIEKLSECVLKLSTIMSNSFGL